MTLALEHLSPTDSPIARWDARWKLFTLTLTIIGVTFLRTLWVSGIAFVFALILVMIARLPGRWFRPRIGTVALALSPFLLIVPLTNENGWIPATTLFLRGLAVTSIALVLLGTAPLVVTLHAAQRLRVPGLFVQLTLLSYRYVFLLAEEFGRIRIALRVRGFRNRANRHSYRTIGQVTGTLLVRGNDRADRVNHAMRCRGFDGRFRCLHTFRTTISDAMWSFGVLVIVTGLFIADLRLRGVL